VSDVSLSRELERPFLSPADEAAEYHAMDHDAVNRRFLNDLLAAPVGTHVIDLGCGPADLPIDLCRRVASIRVMGIDAEIAMLDIAKRQIDIAGMLDRISLEHGDVCSLEHFQDALADTVISNSLLHHLAQPQRGLQTALRLVRPGGRLFLRDLCRPASAEQVETLVEQYAAGESDNARQLLRQSLLAALTLDEIRGIAAGLAVPGLGISAAHVQMTSDLHWTLDWRRPQ
jgi:ubiquinone/menaquinone biosynthesis C-methylase UbiE